MNPAVVAARKSAAHGTANHSLEAELGRSLGRCEHGGTRYQRHSGRRFQHDLEISVHEILPAARASRAFVILPEELTFGKYRAQFTPGPTGNLSL